MTEFDNYSTGVLFNNESYVVPDFKNTPSITRIHTKNRFGRTNEISFLINGSNEDQKSYVWGIVIASMVIFGCFLVWSICLLCFKCLGPARVGFLSGHPIQKPKPLEDTDDEEEEREEHFGSQPYEESYSSSFYHASRDNVEVDEGGILEKKPESQEGGIAVGVPAIDNEEEEEEEFNYDEFKGGSTSLEQSASFDDAPLNGDTPPDVSRTEGAPEADLAEKWNRQNKRANRTLIATRVIVLCCCVGIIVASILFLVYGIDGLVSTVKNGRKGISLVESAVNQAIEIIDNYLAEQGRVTRSAIGFLNETAEWCPTLRDKILDGCRDNIDLCDFSEIPFQEEIDQVKIFMNDTKNLIFNEVAALRDDLEEVLVITNDVDQAAENFNWAFYVSAAFVVILDLIVIAYMYGVIQAWREKQTRCYRVTRSFFIVPTMALIMFLGWLFSIIFLMGAFVTADFCVDSPDQRLIQILDNNKDRFNSVVFRYFIYLLEGCTSANPIFVVFGDQIQVILEIVGWLKDLLTKIREAETNSLEQLCGVSGSAINMAATVLNAQLAIIEILLLQLGNFFSCGTFHPIYTTVAYDAVCYSGVDGLTWMFSTQLTIAVLTMIIITFRAAGYKSEAYNVAG